MPKDVSDDDDRSSEDEESASSSEESSTESDSNSDDDESSSNSSNSESEEEPETQPPEEPSDTMLKIQSSDIDSLFRIGKSMDRILKRVEWKYFKQETPSFVPLHDLTIDDNNSTDNIITSTSPEEFDLLPPSAVGPLESVMEAPDSIRDSLDERTHHYDNSDDIKSDTTVPLNSPQRQAHPLAPSPVPLRDNHFEEKVSAYYKNPTQIVRTQLIQEACRILLRCD